MKKTMLVFILFSFQSILVFSEEPAPKISFSESAFDFGEITQGNKVTHKFPFKNDGNAVLNVDKVQTSCGCTAAVAGKKQLAPQESSEIEVTYNSAGRSGEVNKSIFVFSNDAHTPRFEIKIHGSIVTVLTIDPAVLNFGTIPLGQSVEKEIKIKLNQQRAPLKITQIEKSTHVEWTPADGVIDGEKETIFKLKLTPDPRLGFVSERVTLHFDDAGVFPVSIPISGRVEGPVSVFPARINFFIRQGQSAAIVQKIAITNNTNEPLDIQKVEFDEQIFDVKAETVEKGRKYELTVSLKEGLKENFINKLIKVNTNQTALPVIEIPAQVWNQLAPVSPTGGNQQQQQQKPIVNTPPVK